MPLCDVTTAMVSRCFATPDEIKAIVERIHPGALAAVEKAQTIVPFVKRQIWPWQAAALYGLVRAYDREDCRILEIGTAWGYSAAVIALAAPEAIIITLNPKASEYGYAVKHLAGLSHCFPIMEHSWRFLEGYSGEDLDLVFVDGDHTAEGVRRDMPWFNHLKPGGLMLFHDYAPEGSSRPTPAVYEAVNEMARRLGRQFDVLIADHTGTGMAGFYRHSGEAYRG